MVLDTTDSSSPPSNPPNDRYQPDLDGPAGRQFQTLLVSLGVAQPGGLPVAKLAKMSGLGRETWRRCASEGALCKLESLPAMAAALRQCGRHITDQQLAETLLADLAARKTKVPSFRATSVQSSASPADLMLSVIRGVPDVEQRNRFIRQVAARLTTDERAAWVAGMFTPQGDVAQQETSRDGNGDGNGDGNTSTDGSSAGRTS